MNNTALRTKAKNGFNLHGRITYLDIKRMRAAGKTDETIALRLGIKQSVVIELTDRFQNN